MDRIKNIIRAWPLFISRNALFASFACLVTIAGCSGMKAAAKPPDSTGTAATAGGKPQEPAGEATEEKKEKPREILRESVSLFGFLTGGMLVLGVALYVVCRFR